MKICSSPHSELVSFTIKGQTPSKKNSKQIFINKRTNRPFITSSENYKNWYQDAYYQVKGEQIEYKTKMMKAVVNIRFFNKDKRRRDLDNMLSSILDLMVETKVIPDDSCEVIESVVASFGGVDKENPRAEVRVIRKRAYDRRGQNRD